MIIAFLFTDVFDTSGTLIGVAHQAGLLDKKGNLPRLHRALISDSIGHRGSVRWPVHRR